MATVVDAVQSFPGLRGLLVPTTVSSPEMDDITEDFTAEQETILVGESNMSGISTTSESCHAAGTGSIDTTLQSTLMEALKGVTEGTNAEYKRCNSINLDGTPKPSHVEWGTYGHAQKMRVSMTYWGWLMVGNPSISMEVSSYMCLLHRHKVQAGKAANSAWAITLEILLKLYHYNHRPENWTIQAYQPGDQIMEANSPMSSEQFLELFRNNLLDVDIDPTPYGTHSFWRGGVPVLACREVLVTPENL
ncbi:hypothetical protein BDR05DRAFT_995070 [Suillus weaverae]|nr:hypothetical protein BDR05DRAFT_995070 [Suillus weaverae]